MSRLGRSLERSLSAQAGVALVCVLFGVLALDRWAISALDAPPPQAALADPGAEFNRLTGLAWPADALVLSSGDDHGGLQWEGEVHVVARVAPTTIADWLASSPPWRQPAWQHGPVAPEVAARCRLGAAAFGQAEGRYSQRTWSLESVRYVAAERCCEGLRWHNGSLLVLDPRQGLVWLSVWDF
jgi:hypothetical protein